MRAKTSTLNTHQFNILLNLQIRGLSSIDDLRNDPGLAEKHKAYTTTLSCLQLLRKNGLVDATRESKHHIYTITAKGKSYLRETVRSIASQSPGKIMRWILEEFEGRISRAERQDLLRRLQKK